VITDLAELDADDESDDGRVADRSANHASLGTGTLGTGEPLDTGVTEGGREPYADRLGDGIAEASGRMDDVAGQQGHMEEPNEAVEGESAEGQSLEDRGRFVGVQKGAQTQPASEDVL
jgi:hypothetical protein